MQGSSNYSHVMGPPQHAYVPPTQGHVPSTSATKYLAVAVQLVYIGPQGTTPMVASRVAITDYRGIELLNTFVQPTHPIINYRTEVTGLQPAHFKYAPPFHDVRMTVLNMVADKILVGYNLWDFLLVMGLQHSAIQTRDIALFLPFRKTMRHRDAVPLPQLVNYFMSRQVAPYEDPCELARASLDLFRSVEPLWEKMVADGAWPCDLPPPTYASYFK